MLILSSPQLLFKKQKLFRLPASSAHKLSSEQRRILIVFESDSEMLQPRLKEMVDKLIKACLFRVENAVYFNFRSSNGATLESLKKQFEPFAVLVFGRIDIGTNLAKNTYDEQCGIKIMYSEPLETIAPSKTEKAELWVALQKMFKLN